MSKVGFVGLGIMGTPMAEHLIKGGHEVYLYSIPSIPEPLVQAGGKACASGKEVAQHAERMEQANTQGINAVYEAALAAKDYPAQVLMHWFINEQVEEEAWTAEMVERVRGATCALRASF